MRNKTPFDPRFHSSVVGNFRRGFEERFGKPTTLTNESIWNLFEEWGLCVDDEHPDDHDHCVYDAMKEAQDAYDENTKP